MYQLSLCKRMSVRRSHRKILTRAEKRLGGLPVDLSGLEPIPGAGKGTDGTILTIRGDALQLMLFLLPHMGPMRRTLSDDSSSTPERVLRGVIETTRKAEHVQAKDPIHTASSSPSTGNFLAGAAKWSCDVLDRFEG